MKAIFSLVILLSSTLAYAQYEAYAVYAQDDAPERKSNFHVGIFLSTAKNIKFENADLRTLDGRYSLPGQTIFDIESNFGLAVGMQSLPAQGWGYTGQISYEKGINFKSGTLEYDGYNAIKFDLNDTELSLFNLEANAAYSFGKFFIPGGLNYTAPTFKSDESTTYKVSGAIGYQIGVVYNALERLNLKLSFKSQAIDFSQKNDEVHFAHGVGKMEGFQFQSQFLF